MKIIENEKLIKRNARIGQIATFAGLFVLIGGMVISFSRPELFIYSFLALLMGFILSQVGLYFGGRWGRKPRIDQVLNAGLKGLDSRHAIYHYTTPIAHLMVGPSGVWVIIARMQRGNITFSKGRWRQKTPNNPLRALGDWYMRIFAQESIDRPDLEIKAELEQARQFISKLLGDNNVPEVKAVLVFTHPDVVLDIPEDETPPAPSVILKDLKELIRKSAKANSLSNTQVTQLQEALEA